MNDTLCLRLLRKHILRNRTNTRPEIFAPSLSFACARRTFFPRWKSYSRRGGDAKGNIFLGSRESKAGESARKTLGRDTTTSTRGRVIQFSRRYPGYKVVYKRRGQSRGSGYGNAAVACIERPDFATGQPGQPDFNFADLTSATQFPAYVTGTLEGLGPVADVLVLEIHFRRRARAGIAIYSATRPRRKRIRDATFFRRRFIRETRMTRFAVRYFFAQEKYAIKYATINRIGSLSPSLLLLFKLLYISSPSNPRA